MSTMNDAVGWALVLVIVYGMILAFLRARNWYYGIGPYQEKQEYYTNHVSLRKDK